MMVQHCCCCFSLRYGFFTFGIIELILRICIASASYFADPYDTHLYRSSTSAAITALRGYVFGWYLVTAGIVFIALKGIARQKSILLYPYMVMLSLELVLCLISGIIFGLVFQTWHFVFFGISFGFTVYCFICLRSLYKKIQEFEVKQPRNEANSFNMI